MTRGQKIRRFFGREVGNVLAGDTEVAAYERRRLLEGFGGYERYGGVIGQRFKGGVATTTGQREGKGGVTGWTKNMGVFYDGAALGGERRGSVESDMSGRMTGIHREDCGGDCGAARRRSGALC